jgi:hypothetical protein
MQQISPAIQSLLKHNNISELRHKLLLYRRKWNTVTSAYIIEAAPVDITDAINHKGTNVSIIQQLDNDAANVWKVGNLALTLYNENNRFWQDKEDGLFPQPYIIYGSKVEYYIGSPTLNDYVKCFTGYLTELPNYRQDEGLVEIRALNRLDWLKTISAENVSTKIKNEQLIEQDTTHCITANAAVGRIQRVLKGTSLSDAVELTEKTDYTVSQLNDYNSGAIIELKSALLSNENIWADYIYWKKGITIDVLVNELLMSAGIDEAHRIVEPVVFQNALRIANETLISNAWAWLCHTTSNGFSEWHDGDGSWNDYYYGTFGSSLGNSGIMRWGCNMKHGSIRFRLNKNNGTAYNPGINFVYLSLGSGIQGQDLVLIFGGEGGGGVNRTLRINFKNQGNQTLGSYSDNDIFYIAFDSSTVRLYKNSSQIWLISSANFYASQFSLVVGYARMEVELNLLAAKPSTDPFDSNAWYYYQAIIFQTQNSQNNFFLGFDRLNAIVSTIDAPIPQIQVSYGNNSANWTPYYQYQLSLPLQLNYNSIRFIITNTASFGNNYNLSSIKLWSFLQQNIPLGVCNLTNMSILDALQELASLAMYEIGFDADDKFFFRKREQTTQYKEITDNDIISMSSAKSDIARLKTRIVVSYGGYTKVVDSDEMNEQHPTNKDKYGERVYEISGSQLLPADNVDLAYAIAPTIYEELSKLRLTLSIDIIIDLELELGDYVRVLHNNNLFADKGFTDLTKWKETGTYYMKCKVVGIKTDFNKRITTLDLIDYTADTDIPVEQAKEFAYQPQETFDIKK